MTCGPRSIAKHRLNIREGCQPVREKRRGQAPDRNKATQEEVAKLMEVKIVREVHYHDWLLNPVMVKKHDGSWRIRLQRYHQIQMAKDDEEKTFSMLTKESSAIRRCRSVSRMLERHTNGFWVKHLKNRPAGTLRTTNGNRTETNRRANNVPLYGQRSADFITERPDKEGPPMEAPAKEIQAARRNHIRQRKVVQVQPIQRLVQKAQRQAKVEEVPHVLWAYRTMIKISNEDTLFSLTYGTEAVIPIEMGMPSLRCAKVNQAEDDEGLLLNLDILEERREKAAIHEVKSKAKMEKYYNSKVYSTIFRPGDFVYHNNEASHAKKSGKLGPNGKGHTK
nr:reverse transcriptase domain-containing protein [Tanacetum cinerariifolium]